MSVRHRITVHCDTEGCAHAWRASAKVRTRTFDGSLNYNDVVFEAVWVDNKPIMLAWTFDERTQTATCPVHKVKT